jgi:hypothetical protein
MLSQLTVKTFIHLVKDKIEEVKSGDEGGRQVDIPRNWEFYVVLGSNRIGGCKDGSPGV